jgi:lysyl-tRNA synthetase class 2
MKQTLGRGNLIDLLYKKVSRPKIINPTFLIEHPIDLSPLARANDDNPQLTDRFQLIINGVEIINAYSELVNPKEQKERLIEQAHCKANGDEEAMVMDEDYIIAMEFGMPPISGWGMGIDRVFQVLTGTNNIKDSIMFPLMRPIFENEQQESF